MRSLVFAGLLTLLTLSSMAEGQNLSKEQEGLLSALDDAAVTRCVEILAKVKGYRSDVEALQRVIADSGKKPADLIASPEFVKAAERVLQLHEDWGQLPEQVQTYLRIREVVLARLMRADKEAKAAVFDPNAFPDLNEEQFRVRARVVARAEAAADLAEVYRTDILKRVESLKDPAEIVRKTLRETIAQHMQKPLPITKDVQVYFTPNDAALTKSPFAEGAGITVTFKYQADLEVKVKGVYFKLEKGVPTPKFDRLEKPDLGALASANLRNLGNAFPVDLGCGITLKNIEFVDFRDATSPDAGALKFDIIVGGFMDSILGDSGSKLKAEARGCKIYPSGKVKVTELVFTNDTLIIPIGGTPLTMIGYTIAVTPEKKAFSVGTKIAAGPSTEGAYMQLTLSSQLPLTQGVRAEGKLYVAGGALALGKVEGELTPRGLKVKLDVPGDSPVAVLARARAEMKMDRDGLNGHGDFLFYSIINANFQMHLAPDGSGRFSGDAGNREVLGLRLGGEITADFEPGFKNLIVRLEAPVRVNLGGLLQGDTVIVSLHGTDKELTCRASGFGKTVGPFPLTPNDNLQQILEKEFGRVLQDAAQAVTDALAQADPFNRNSFAGKGAKELDPFNKDSALRRAADELQPAKVGSIASKFMPKLDPTQGPVGDVLRSNGINIDVRPPIVPDGVPNPFEGLSNPFGFHKTPLWKSRYLAADFRRHDSLSQTLLLTTLLQEGGSNQAAADADFAHRLTRLIVSLQEVQLRENPAATSSNTPKGRTARSTSVAARVLAPTMTAVGDDTILIGFVVKTSGHGTTITPRSLGKSERLKGSEIKGGSIVLTKDKDRPGRWRGKLNMPKLEWEKYTYLDPSPRLRQKLEDLVEFTLPTVDVDGPVRRFEKHLVINNATKEKLVVHLQRRTMTRVGDKFDWVWLPGEPDTSKKFQFTIEPGAKLKVTHKLLGSRPDQDSEKEFSASRVRLWAESKDGDRWLQHKNEDLWLVDKNPKLKSERVYVAEQFGAYTHTFRPQTGVRQFSERTVTLRNKTDKKLKVSLDYLSFEDGNLRWRSAPDFEIPPKATVEVRDKEDLLLRAQAIKFKAVSPEFTFQAHWTTPLWIVDAVEGRRVYRGSKIGNYLHTLEPLE